VGSILLGLGVLGILGHVVDAATRAGRSAHSANVGQCISEFSFRDNVLNPAAQDCPKPDSLFEVAAKGDASTNCPDGKLQDSRYAFLRDGTTTLCLLLNFEQGQCYTATGQANNPTFAATARDGSLPRFKVVQRINGSSDAVPARLYWLERLQN
jgi:hypothetical protein